jgi:hypothetical protein
MPLSRQGNASRQTATCTEIAIYLGQYYERTKRKGDSYFDCRPTL